MGKFEHQCDPPTCEVDIPNIDSLVKKGLELDKHYMYTGSVHNHALPWLVGDSQSMWMTRTRTVIHTTLRTLCQTMQASPTTWLPGNTNPRWRGLAIPQWRIAKGGPGRAYRPYQTSSRPYHSMLLCKDNELILWCLYKIQDYSHVWWPLPSSQ